MRPILLALVGLVLYSLNAVIIEKMSATYRPAVLLTVVYAAVVVLLASRMLYLHASSTPVYPTGGELVLGLIAGVAVFFGTYAYYGAFAGGGSIMAITCIIATMPAISSLMKYVSTGGAYRPNIYHLGAWFLIFIAVVLVAKGESIASG